MNPSAFRHSFLEKLLENSFHYYDDNWPEYRFGKETYGDRQKQQHIWFMEILLDNLHSFAQACALFADEVSKNIYHDVLQYKSLGPLHVKLHTHDDAYCEYIEHLNSHLPGITLLEKAAIQHDRWSLNLYQVHQLELKVYATAGFGLSYFHFGQYFFSRDGVHIRPEPGDVILDCGACWGDSSMLFAKIAGPQGHVHAFEFVEDNLSVFEMNLALNQGEIDNVTLCRKGLSDVDGQELRYTPNGPGTWVLPNGEYISYATNIDTYAESQGLDKVDYIKMDIEGFERSALIGAEATIRRHKPKLAISVYHKNKDLFEIPLTIKEMFPWYTLYLDHHTTYGEETVLYAIAE